jgi:hypothetical protein
MYLVSGRDQLRPGKEGKWMQAINNSGRILEMVVGMMVEEYRMTRSKEGDCAEKLWRLVLV